MGWVDELLYMFKDNEAFNSRFYGLLCMTPGFWYPLTCPETWPKELLC